MSNMSFTVMKIYPEMCSYKYIDGINHNYINSHYQFFFFKIILITNTLVEYRENLLK